MKNVGNISKAVGDTSRVLCQLQVIYESKLFYDSSNSSAAELTSLTTMPNIPVQDPSGSLLPKVLSGDNTYLTLNQRVE